MKSLFYFFALLQTFHDFLDFHDFITDHPYRNFPGRGVYLNAFSLFDFFGFIVTYKVQKLMCLFPDVTCGISRRGKLFLKSDGQL